jgi:glucuronosyltransferase
MSALARDRPLNAQSTAIFWIEYVIRHNGAPHLHYPAADLNFLQFNSIDVVLFLIAAVYAFIKILKLVLRKICCCSVSGKSEGEKRKSKMN